MGVAGELARRDGVPSERRPEVDAATFAALYERYHPKLLRFVSRQVRAHDIAEDLTQEAFAQALAGMSDLHDPARFYPWIRTIAQRLVYRHYTLSGQVRPVADLDPGIASPTDEYLLREAERGEVADAFARLQGRHRAVLWLREEEELSYAEIAQRLGATATTVPPLLHRARAALRREYLALAELDRMSLLPPAWLGLVDALRRLRDRTLQAAAYFPDAHALSGSMTAVAVSVTGLLGLADPGAMGADRHAAPSPSLAAHGPADADGGAAAASMAGRHSSDDAPAAGTPDITTMSPYRPKLTTDERTADRNSQHDAQMPYYFDFGLAELGADPEVARRIAESSLEGNYDWMEGE